MLTNQTILNEVQVHVNWEILKLILGITVYLNNSDVSYLSTLGVILLVCLG